MQSIDGDKLRGHLETLILATLAKGEAHGLEILRRLEVGGCGLLKLKEGSLYPALYRLEAKGWIAGSWALSEKGKRARYYRITPAGRRQLTSEHSKWNTFARAMGLLLKPLGEEGR